MKLPRYRKVPRLDVLNVSAVLHIIRLDNLMENASSIFIPAIS